MLLKRYMKFKAMDFLTCEFEEYLDNFCNYVKSYSLTKDDDFSKSWMVYFTDGTEAKIKVIIKNEGDKNTRK